MTIPLILEESSHHWDNTHTIIDGDDTAIVNELRTSTYNDFSQLQELCYLLVKTVQEKSEKLAETKRLLDTSATMMAEYVADDEKLKERIRDLETRLRKNGISWF